MKPIKHEVMNKFTIYQHEQDLLKGLDVIQNYFRTITTTSNDIFGKYVRRIYKIGEPNIYGEDNNELENWYITLPVYNETNIPTLLDVFQFLASDYEQSKIREVGEDVHNLTLYNLCDWQFLARDDGHIIHNNTVTIVRYAKILRNK